ncbi:MAG: hypothetical protein RL417_1240 [Pseudomonadota bacterium]|jgi:CheY-like chemotaxis protein
MKSVLLIEDSPDFRDDLEMLLTDDKYLVVSVPCPHDAFEALKREQFDIILCDLHMPFILDERIVDYPYSIEVGIQTIKTLRDTLPETPIIGITASMPSDLARLEQENDLGPLLQKPFSRDQLIRTLEAYTVWAMPAEAYH